MARMPPRVPFCLSNGHHAPRVVVFLVAPMPPRVPLCLSNGHHAPKSSCLSSGPQVYPSDFLMATMPQEYPFLFHHAPKRVSPSRHQVSDVPKNAQKNKPKTWRENENKKRQRKKKRKKGERKSNNNKTFGAAAKSKQLRETKGYVWEDVKAGREEGWVQTDGDAWGQ